MTSAMILPPFGRIDGLERLDFLDWQEIGDAAQAVLSDLDQTVRSHLSDVAISAGLNRAGDGSIFVYRAFSRQSASPAVDGVVVGITLRTTQTAVLLDGDIAGETLGDILVETPTHEATGKLSVLERVRDLAEKLVTETGILISALRDPARRI